MYTHIYAESLVHASTGKTMRVWSEVEKMTFRVAETEQLLEIKASCRDRESSGDRGGNYIPVTRQFLLQLNKPEVEKLVATALNEKLLKKLNISNLAQIDTVSKLELEASQLRRRLEEANAMIARLRGTITNATVVLNEP